MFTSQRLQRTIRNDCQNSTININKNTDSPDPDPDTLHFYYNIFHEGENTVLEGLYQTFYPFMFSKPQIF
jgi:hypothetical protein